MMKILAPPPAEAPPSLGTLAARLVTCAHPERARVALPGSPAGPVTMWCGACGALYTDDGAGTPWRPAAVAARLGKKHFEDVIVLLHSVTQLAALARAQPVPSASASPAHAFVRSVRASLAELARLPVVRDVDRLEEAIHSMPAAPVRP